MPNGTPFIETDPMFDPDSLLAIGEAFDRVLAVVSDDAAGNVMLETAAAIIARAGDGERDPDRLVEWACGKVGFQRGDIQDPAGWNATDGRRIAEPI